MVMILVGIIVKMVWGRGNVDNAIMDMLRKIAKILEAIEIAQRRGVHIEDFSDDKEVIPNPNLEPKVEQDKDRLLRVLCGKTLGFLLKLLVMMGDLRLMWYWIGSLKWKNILSMKVLLIIKRLR